MIVIGVIRGKRNGLGKICRGRSIIFKREVSGATIVINIVRRSKLYGFGVIRNGGLVIAGIIISETGSVLLRAVRKRSKPYINPT